MSWRLLRSAAMLSAPGWRADLWRRASILPATAAISEALRAAFGRIESAAAFQSGGDLIQGKGWQGRPAYMPKALSFDLRSRVLAAIDEGLSCRQAATRFGVSASSAIRWQGMRREGGEAPPHPPGGVGPSP